MAKESVQRRLAAILAADVVGYSRLIRFDEEGTLAALKTLRADIIDPKIAENHGRIVKLMGDGMLAEFSSVVDAVRTAAEIQRAVAERNADQSEEQRIDFRVGINLGDVIIDGDDIQGDGVNVASRLEGLAEPGGICISAAVYDQVRDRIELSFEDLGEQAVKNIDRPIRVWQWTNDASVTAEGPATTDEPIPLVDQPSIAVLPFNNLSGSAEQEYFVDGITEEIITALSRFRDLMVIARNSTFQYKGQSVDVRVVGQELGARYVLEGSVRRAGDRIRATAQLLDAGNGGYLWAETYQRDLTAADVFEIQDDIAERVVGTIADSFGVLSQVRLKQKRRKDTDSLNAFEAVLRARAYYRDNYSADEHYRVRDWLERAVELDPNYADAWAWLAGAYRDEYYQHHNPRPDPLIRAETAARKAIALDPDNQQANLVLAHVDFFNGDVGAFRALADKTISLNPNSADKLGSLATFMCFIGEWDRGVEMARKAIGLSARPAGFFFLPLAFDHYRKREYAEALAITQKSDLLRLYRTQMLLAAINGQLGRREPAQAALDKLLELYPDFAIEGWNELRRGNVPENLIAQLFDGLRKAGLEFADGSPATDQ